jgi:hypothetical protein
LINQEVMMLAELSQPDGIFGCLKAEIDPTASPGTGSP